MKMDKNKKIIYLIFALIIITAIVFSIGYDIGRIL